MQIFPYTGQLPWLCLSEQNLQLMMISEDLNLNTRSFEICNICWFYQYCVIWRYSSRSWSMFFDFLIFLTLLYCWTEGLVGLFRSSQQRCSIKKVFYQKRSSKKYQKIHRKHLCWSLFITKEHLWVTASDFWSNLCLHWLAIMKITIMSLINDYWSFPNPHSLLNFLTL